jgi:DNA-3-methyladenine glycosylase
MIPPDFFLQDVAMAARALIGMTFCIDGVGGVIVETEAYAQDDAASHAYTRQTARNAAMFGPPGQAYVYRSYGLHWCLNLVCAEAGRADAVLIRALEPLYGLEVMAERRGLTDVRRLCAGPGRLGQALGVTRALDGAPLDRPPFTFSGASRQHGVVVGPRVGITRAVETPWRFGLAGSPYLSRPFREAPRPRLKPSLA